MRPLLCDLPRFVAAVRGQHFRPYGWNCDGPLQFDCSGLVCFGILEAGGPDLRASHNAQRFFDELQPVDAWHQGDVLLAHYGKSETHVEHVMVVLEDGQAFGATKGDRTIVTIEDAQKAGAFIRFKPTYTYRRDLLGLRELRYRPGFPKPRRPDADAA